jgi:hypothetical protein
LYKLRLENNNKWGKIWNIIEQKSNTSKQIYEHQTQIIKLERKHLLQQNMQKAKLVPKYARTKINEHKALLKQTIDKIHKTRINNEIKYWLMKKQILNKQLYKLHLENSNKWGKIWNTIYATGCKQ